MSSGDTHDRIGTALAARRFDLTEHALHDLVIALLCVPVPVRRERMSLHYEQLEGLLDALRDLFALERMPPTAGESIVDGIVADWPDAVEPMVRASLVASMRMVLRSQGASLRLKALCERRVAGACEVERAARGESPAEAGRHRRERVIAGGVE